MLVASQPHNNLLDRIKEGMEQDTMASNLLKLAIENKTRQFWARDGIFYTVGNRVFVPK